MCSCFQVHDYKTDQAITFWSENRQRIQVCQTPFWTPICPYVWLNTKTMCNGISPVYVVYLEVNCWVKLSWYYWGGAKHSHQVDNSIFVKSNRSGEAKSWCGHVSRTITPSFVALSRLVYQKMAGTRNRPLTQDRKSAGSQPRAELTRVQAACQQTQKLTGG